MSDAPGKRSIRFGIRFKIAVSIGIIMVALMGVDIAWNLSLQTAQAENEAREKAEVLAAEMRAAWDFVDMNQNVINRAEDGSFRTKHLVCVVAAKSISMLFTTETDYSIRFTNDTPRQAANAPDAFEQEALDAFNADAALASFYRVEEAADGTRVFRYTEPLYVTESCLECHGDPAGEPDQYGYAKEGMEVGQVGGAMSITEPMDIYGDGIRSSVAQQVIMVLFVMVAAFAAVYAVTSRLVLRPLDELRRAAKSVGEGDFSYLAPTGKAAAADGAAALGTSPAGRIAPSVRRTWGGPDELTELSGEFDRMARDLQALYEDLEGQVRSKTDDLMLLNDLLNYQKRELKCALDRLGEEVAYKNEFFAIVSHELRTPLTSILAYARILNDDASLAPKTRDAVAEIESNATLLLNMVNNILVISKHAAQKDELVPEPVDFVDVAQFVKKALDPIAAGKDVALTCTVAPDVPLSMADWEKLRRVLENLVDNAVKYTHRDGFVKLAISFDADGFIERQGDCEHGVIVMRVSDDGMGIASDEVDEIFDLYKQAGQSANRRYRGTGLGLAVVRDLTELHGGAVSVESRVKEGSTFTVRIPAVPVPEEDEE